MLTLHQTAPSPYLIPWNSFCATKTTYVTIYSQCINTQHHLLLHFSKNFQISLFSRIAQSKHEFPTCLQGKSGNGYIQMFGMRQQRVPGHKRSHFRKTLLPWSPQSHPSEPSWWKTGLQRLLLITQLTHKYSQQHQLWHSFLPRSSKTWCHQEIPPTIHSRPITKTPVHLCNHQHQPTPHQRMQHNTQQYTNYTNCWHFRV